MTLEEFGGAFFLGGSLMGIVNTLFIIQGYRNSWCKYCKQRHRRDQFTPS